MSAANGAQIKGIKLASVDGVSVSRLLKIAKRTCGERYMVRRFATDIAGLLALMGKQGAPFLTLTDTKGTQYTVTNSKQNRRSVARQWQRAYGKTGKKVFNANKCPLGRAHHLKPPPTHGSAAM